MKTGKVDALLGIVFGDEGKGKVVDYFTPKYDVVARFAGVLMPDTRSYLTVRSLCCVLFLLEFRRKQSQHYRQRLRVGSRLV